MNGIVSEKPNRVGWPPGYLHHAKDGSLIDSGLALLGSGIGFRALWVDAETKQPTTRNGVKDATDYGSELYQAWESLPEHRTPALAITMPPGTAVLDVDDGTPWRLLGRPDAYTATETTGRGWHQFVSLPEPFTHTSRHAVGELRAGPDSYTIIAPSPGYGYFVLGGDPANTRWFRELPADGAIWLNHVRAGVRVVPDLDSQSWATTRLPATDKLITRLVEGTYGQTVTMIMQGRGEDRYNSRSESDFALLFLASHFTNDPEILADLLQRYSRKLPDKSTQSQKDSYIGVTIPSAISARQLTDHQRLTRIANRLHIPAPIPTDLLASSTPRTNTNRLTVYVGTPPEEERVEVVEMVKRWASLSGDEWDRGAGWRRVPMDDLEAASGWNRKTIWRWIRKLAASGVIEYDPTGGSRCDKGYFRRDSMIRWKG